MFKAFPYPQLTTVGLLFRNGEFQELLTQGTRCSSHSAWTRSGSMSFPSVIPGSSMRSST